MPMMVIRPAESGDLTGVYTLAAVASDGITTLPVSKERLLERITASEETLAKDIKTPGSESYFLVLEEYVGLKAEAEKGGEVFPNGKTDEYIEREVIKKGFGEL